MNCECKAKKRSQQQILPMRERTPPPSPPPNPKQFRNDHCEEGTISELFDPSLHASSPSPATICVRKIDQHPAHRHSERTHPDPNTRSEAVASESGPRSGSGDPVVRQRRRGVGEGGEGGEDPSSESVWWKRRLDFERSWGEKSRRGEGDGELSFDSAGRLISEGAKKGEKGLTPPSDAEDPRAATS